MIGRYPHPPAGGELSAPGLAGIRLMYLELLTAGTGRDDPATAITAQVVNCLNEIIHTPAALGYVESARTIAAAHHLLFLAENHREAFTAPSDHTFEYELADEALRLVTEYATKVEQDDADLRDRLHRSALAA